MSSQRKVCILQARCIIIQFQCKQFCFVVNTSPSSISEKSGFKERIQEFNFKYENDNQNMKMIIMIRFMIIIIDVDKEKNN